MIVETDGRDVGERFARHRGSAAPRVIEWEALMKSLQEPPPGSAPDEWWAAMRPVFRLADADAASSGPLDADHGSASLAAALSSPPHRHHRRRWDRAIGAPSRVSRGSDIRSPASSTSIAAAAQSTAAAFGVARRVRVPRGRGACRRRCSIWPCQATRFSAILERLPAWRAGPDSETDGARILPTRGDPDVPRTRGISSRR